MVEGLNPAFILIVGGMLTPLIPRVVRAPYLLSIPVLAVIQFLSLDRGIYDGFELFEMATYTMRIDHLSFVFGLIFHFAAFVAVVYAIHVKDTMQHVAALVYAGATVGAVLAADLISLFVYWELTAVSSVFLIWARRTERSFRAGLRYLIVQVGSGVILLTGIILHYEHTGSLEFGHLVSYGFDSPGIWWIFIAFGIKCAFPGLHGWLKDAYPEATVTGTVVLSAFTTKLAIYTLARGFAGTDMLIWIGATMTAFPIFFAVLENDLRRVLSYSLNNQLGFMVVGIGIGTEMALNGTAAHAFCHIMYKALLFMSMGAVLFRTGKINASQLGGLYKSMPLTTVFCCIGALSISAFPLFSGFVSKSMILLAAAEEHHTIAFLVLLFASAGVVDHSGIKVPFFAFFAHDSGIRCKEAPWNMLVAMAIAAVFCVGLGCYPQPLYDILPFETDFQPYTVTHVVTQLQLLMFSALAFIALMRSGLYPPELRSVNLDIDWLYRRLAPWVLVRVGKFALATHATVTGLVSAGVSRVFVLLDGTVGPRGYFTDRQSTGSMAMWVAVFLGVCLFFYYT